MKPKFRITEVNRYWKYHIHRRVFGVWWKIGGRDDIGRAEDFIKGKLPAKNVGFYDEKGEKINDSKGDPTS